MFRNISKYPLNEIKKILDTNFNQLQTNVSTFLLFYKFLFGLVLWDVAILIFILKILSIASLNLQKVWSSSCWGKFQSYTFTVYNCTNEFILGLLYSKKIRMVGFCSVAFLVNGVKIESDIGNFMLGGPFEKSHRLFVLFFCFILGSSFV